MPAPATTLDRAAAAAGAVLLTLAAGAAGNWFLDKRGATPSEEYVRSSYGVLRYEAPLADLLGLPTELSLLTSGKAKHWIVLSHYALVQREPDPGGRAA